MASGFQKKFHKIAIFVFSKKTFETLSKDKLVLFIIAKCHPTGWIFAKDLGSALFVVAIKLFDPITLPTLVLIALVIIVVTKELI